MGQVETSLLCMEVEIANRKESWVTVRVFIYNDSMGLHGTANINLPHDLHGVVIDLNSKRPLKAHFNTRFISRIICRLPLCLRWASAFSFFTDF